MAALNPFVCGRKRTVCLSVASLPTLIMLTQQSQMADQCTLLICATLYSVHQSDRDLPCYTHLPSFNTPDYLYGGGAIENFLRSLLLIPTLIFFISQSLPMRFAFFMLLSISLNSFIAQIAWVIPLGTASNHYNIHKLKSK